MTNQNMGVTTLVELGAPTLSINPPAKTEEKSSGAQPSEVDTKDDVAANRDQD
jgi:hypothetical protein